MALIKDEISQTRMRFEMRDTRVGRIADDGGRSAVERERRGLARALAATQAPYH